MNKKFPSIILALMFLSIVGAQGCGKKGPLTIPQDSSASSQAQATNQLGLLP